MPATSGKFNACEQSAQAFIACDDESCSMCMYVARQASTRSFLPALPTATVALSSSCSDDPMLSKQTSSRCGLCAGATVDSAPHAPVHEVDRNRVNLRTLASRGTGRDQPATHAKVHALVSRLSHTFRLRTSAKSTTMCVSTPSSRHAAWRELDFERGHWPGQGPAQNRDTGISSRCCATSKRRRWSSGVHPAIVAQLAKHPQPIQYLLAANLETNPTITMSSPTESIIKACSLKRQLSDSHACPEPGCKRQFARKYTLVEHAKTHSGERPHVCPVRTCGKRFSTSGNLSRHKRLHGYIEPLKCPVRGCICTFPSNIKLEKHMKFHYGTANKVCSVPGCGKTFSTTGNFNRHLKNQHDHKQEQVAAATSPPSLNHGASSPTSTEQWFPLPTTAVDSLWSEETTLWESSSSTELFEDVWNPVLLDTLVNIFDDQTTFSC
ncbi:hypothetical protein PF008_g9511 [Phytophthora fragariae]|uniref:C2H2-type domain-containing protein n=1 Tax=Phytophthora fragariae TaxID=53985 RepID=A0A6G0RY09_9STRA|nr:hypothetical protein PF008_g9511 [Phytophthora fragariae]